MSRELFMLLLLVSLVASAACGRTEPPAASSPASTAASTPTPTPPPNPTPTADAYRADVEKFRHDLEDRLTSDTGWLTIAGLSFLTMPEMTFGSDAENDIVLPGATPPRVGRFVLAKDGRISVMLEPGQHIKLLDGRDFTGGNVKTDSDGPPDRLVLGDVQVWVHRSGDRPAVRIRDKNNPLRKSFTGRKWYAIKDGYRVEASYTPYDKPKELKVPNLLGDIDTMTAPGQVTFMLNGKEQTMVPVLDEDELWFIFSDLTSGETTYKAARFLYTAMPKDGKVVLDFNRAENPPCAFNPYATCPLPIRENRLKTRVEAGEKYETH
jgi:uncharacterized protein (DUF1684 family)